MILLFLNGVLGQLLKKNLKKNIILTLDLIAVDSAATLLNKIILEGPNTNADIVLGLDMNSI